MIHSRVTSKSQTTVPLAVRRALDIKPGDTIGYEIGDGQVFLTRVRREDENTSDPFVNPFAMFTEWADDLDSAYDAL